MLTIDHIFMVISFMPVYPYYYCWDKHNQQLADMFDSVNGLSNEGKPMFSVHSLNFYGNPYCKVLTSLEEKQVRNKIMECDGLFPSKTNVTLSAFEESNNTWNIVQGLIAERHKDTIESIVCCGDQDGVQDALSQFESLRTVVMYDYSNTRTTPPTNSDELVRVNYIRCNLQNMDVYFSEKDKRVHVQNILLLDDQYLYHQFNIEPIVVRAMFLTNKEAIRNYLQLHSDVVIEFHKHLLRLEPTLCLNLLHSLWVVLMTDPKCKEHFDSMIRAITSQSMIDCISDVLPIEAIELNIYNNFRFCGDYFVRRLRDINSTILINKPKKLLKLGLSHKMLDMLVDAGFQLPTMKETLSLLRKKCLPPKTVAYLMAREVKEEHNCFDLKTIRFLFDQYSTNYIFFYELEKNLFMTCFIALRPDVWQQLMHCLVENTTIKHGLLNTMSEFFAHEMQSALMNQTWVLKVGSLVIHVGLAEWIESCYPNGVYPSYYQTIMDA
jgi:hypothetical protein